MNPSQVVLVTGFAVLLLVSLLVFVRYIYWPGSQQINRYKFFAIRDELIRLVATGKLKEDEFLFAFFYQTINGIITHTHLVNLTTLVRSQLELAESPVRKQLVERMISEIEKKDAEIKKVVDNFYYAMAITLHKNSLLLQILVALWPVWISAIWFATKISIVGQYFFSTKEPVGLYYAYSETRKQIAHVG